MPARRQAAVALLLWTLFVVYGSLLPFAFTPRPLAEALAAFAAIPTYNIGPAGRADWLANLLLYMPLAFLALWMLDSESRANRALATVIVIAVLAALAIAIEFVQLYFPPRTVSANDLAAEGLGIVLGAFAWHAVRGRIPALVQRYGRGGSAAAGVLAIAYVVLYVVLALLPFDFLLSATEFEQKDIVGQFGWWTAPRGCSELFPCTLQLFVEILVAVPLGLAFVAWRGRASNWGTLAAGGLLLGVTVEFAQLLLASGVTQGASVAAKAAGFVAGGALAPHIEDLSQRLRRSRYLPAAVGLAAVAYAVLLTVVLGFWRATSMTWQEAQARLPEMAWLPFHYYYYTSETRALASLLVQFASFAPIGVLLALAPRSLRPAGAMTIAAAMAAATAFIAQAVRLFHPPQRPDITDVFIAIAAALAGYGLTRALLRLQNDAVATDPAATNATELARAQRRTMAGASHGVAATIPSGEPLSVIPPAARIASWPLRALGTVCGALAVWSLIDYPLSRIALTLAIVVYALLLVRWPHAWYVLLLAALPVADLAGWSGRLYWSEFDCLVLVTLAVAGWRGLPPRAAQGPRHFPVALLLLVALPVAISLVRGLVPLPALDANAFATYTGHYNALRIAKGLLCAVLLCVLAQREGLPPDRQRRLFAYGLATGCALVVAVVVWERFVFTGLLNFAHEYRVTGPFWEMNTGGAYIEGYLVATLPFVVYLLTTERNALLRSCALAVFIAGIYAVLVTMSRNGFAALAVALVVLCAGMVAHFGRNRVGGFKGVFGAVALLGLAGLVAVPILTGATLKGRFATVGEDFNARLEHWTLALELRGDSAANKWLGMGFGRFPDAYFWGSGRPTRPSSYHFFEEGGKTYLRLGGGESLYVEQFVAVEPGTRYTLSFSARTNLPETNVTLPVCEKWLLSSFECAWNNVELRGPSTTFSRHTITFDSGATGKGRWYTRRPVRLALYNPNHQGTIDVAEVQLIGPDGVDRVANGQFTHGMDHWHFSTDSHLPWHTKNLPVQILFDQGWLGALAWAALVAFALARAMTGLWRGDLFATVTLAGLTGFLVVGAFDSMIDTPRLLLLFGLLLWLAAAPRSADAAGATQAPSATA